MSSALRWWLSGTILAIMAGLFIAFAAYLHMADIPYRIRRPMEQTGFALIFAGVESLIGFAVYRGLGVVQAYAGDRLVLAIVASACLLGVLGWLAFLSFALLMLFIL